MVQYKYGQHSHITVVSFENQAKMKALAIGLTTWRIKFLGKKWGLIGLFESLGVLSVKKTKNRLRKIHRNRSKTPNPASAYLHSCFCMNTSHPKHPFYSGKDVLDPQKGVWSCSGMNAVGGHLPVSRRDGTGCVGQVCWQTTRVHFFCSFHMI